MDSMDESTMDSTTDRYEDLLSVHLFVPAVLHHLLHSSGGIIAFSVLFLFFPLREKLSSGSLAGVKTGLSKIYIECILQSNSD